MMPLRPACRRALLILGATLLLAPPLPAQRVAPPPPPVYDVQVNYLIRAGRNQRILQFLEMTRYLESIGFVRAPGADPTEAADPEAERLAGTLPSNRVRDLLKEPHVRTILLAPQGIGAMLMATMNKLLAIRRASPLRLTILPIAPPWTTAPIIPQNAKSRPTIFASCGLWTSR